MILGLYKHYKGHWYLGLFSWAWESSNDQPRVRKVIYLSLNNLRRLKLREVVNLREREEFRGTQHVCPVESKWQGSDCGELLHVQPRFKRVIPWWQP